MFSEITLLYRHGKQFIPDIYKAKVPAPYKGRPEISTEKLNEEETKELVDLCPTNAIKANPSITLDLGKCVFCGECALRFPHKLKFTQDHRMSSNEPEGLIIKEGQTEITLNPDKIRKEILTYFGKSLKLRQVSAAGDNSYECELNACGNVNFDMARFGIEFVASPRHADGIVITGPISENMAQAVQICYDAVPQPKIIILVGVDAISGGIFAGSKALNRSFLDKYPVDLYVPGNPPHPLTFIAGVLEMTRRKR
ncbi:MAG: hydrogenase [Flammeovirgaceae bacterium]